MQSKLFTPVRRPPSVTSAPEKTGQEQTASPTCETTSLHLHLSALFPPTSRLRTERPAPGGHQNTLPTTRRSHEATTRPHQPSPNQPLPVSRPRSAAEGLHRGRIRRGSHLAASAVLSRAEPAARPRGPGARERRGGRLHEVYRVWRGENYWLTKKYLAWSQNPSGAGAMFGLTQRWASDVDAVPQNLEEDEFEDWVWGQGLYRET
jgi:hypothetical protein